MPRLQPFIVPQMRPGEMTFLSMSDTGEHRGRPREMIVARGVVSGIRRAAVNGMVRLPDDRVLVSVRGGTKKQPAHYTAVLSNRLELEHRVEGFGAPFTLCSDGSRVGGSADAATDQLGILDVVSLQVESTSLRAPGGELGGELVAMRDDGSIVRGEEVIATDVELLQVLANGIIGRRGNELVREGGASWAFTAPDKPERVAAAAGRVAVIWKKGFAVIADDTGELILSIDDFASSPAGFYGTIGELQDVALGDSGMPFVAGYADYGALVAVDDSGTYRVSAGANKKKRVTSVLPYGLEMLVGGNEDSLRMIRLLADELA